MLRNFSVLMLVASSVSSEPFKAMTKRRSKLAEAEKT
jgi:hypothetical protein